MAASGFTPIQLYRTTTASAAPTAGNLADGELAINTLDEKLYFKNSAGTVKLLASAAGSAGDVVGPASATDSALVAFNGTTGKLIKQAATVTVAQGGTGQTTANAAFNALAPSQTSNSGKFLTTNGTNTSWSALTPAGSDTQIQYNSSGAFGASAALTFDGAKLSVDGIFITRGANSVDTNVSVGSPLTSNTTGSSNTVVGESGLFSNTTGSNNTAVGSISLSQNSTGSNNTAIGAEALYNNTTGISNTAVGHFALRANTTASNNVALGKEALYSSTSSSNTAVGFYALRSLTTGSSNIAIGYFSGSDITTGVGNTIIGGNFTGSAALDGVLAIGAGSGGAGENRIYVDATGNVGFNTTSPTAAIDHTGSTLRLRTSRTPASASATGSAGEICWDSNYVYVCVATNTWKRSAISTW